MTEKKRIEKKTASIIKDLKVQIRDLSARLSRQKFMREDLKEKDRKQRRAHPWDKKSKGR